jgi:hypothetical protein
MTMFEVMPTFWKACTPELQEEVVCKIDILTNASSDLREYHVF